MLAIGEFLSRSFLGNPIRSYAIALLSFAIGLAAVSILQRVLIRQVKCWTSRTRFEGDDVLIRIIERAALPILYFGVFYASLQSLQLNSTLDTCLDALGAIVLTIGGVRGVESLVEYGLRLYWLSEAWSSDEDRQRSQFKLNLIVPAVRVVLWSLGTIFLLQNLGFDLSAVLASLGIGGVAVALASQGILQDLFSYFAIAIDAPFTIGDFIVVDGVAGTVERIGIKTTRLVSLPGEELVFANSFLTGTRIQNFRKMETRRVVFQVGVTYETPLAQLKEIPGIVERIVKPIEWVTFERCHFATYGDFSLNFETVYYVTGNDYMRYMDVQQRMNLELFEAFAERGIEFAYPTQVLYVNGQESQASTDAPRSPGRSADDAHNGHRALDTDRAGASNGHAPHGHAQ